MKTTTIRPATITIRPATIEDAEICGKMCFEAFKALADQHGFPPDFPSPEAAIYAITDLFSRPYFYLAVGLLDGRVAGCIIASERSTMAGISLFCVGKQVQNVTVGRQLMQHTLNRLKQNFLGIQLIQAAYHNRSLAFYIKLGFEAREMLSVMQGPPLNIQLPGYIVRPAELNDLDACNKLCVKVHGHDRSNELLGAIKQGTAIVVEHHGCISGYATLMGFFGHAAGETNEALKAMIGAASEFLGPGFLVPTRNRELLLWCLNHKLRLVMQMTLMSYGQYNEPQGPFLPSISC